MIRHAREGLAGNAGRRRDSARRVCYLRCRQFEAIAFTGNGRRRHDTRRRRGSRMTTRSLALDFTEIVESTSDLFEVKSAAPGPRGRLPLTAEMLRDSPSGDIFGLTQNAGMGWDPRELGRPQYLMLSTQGGVRAADGRPVALGYHTGHWEVGLLMQAAAEELTRLECLPFAGFVSDPCDGRTQGTVGMMDSLAYRNDAAIVFRRLIRSLPTRKGVMGIATCDKGLPAMMLALAAMRDLPCVLVPGGVTLPPTDGEDAGKVQSIGARFAHGELTLEEASDLGCRACGSPGGGCQFLGTAATSQVVGEALGLSLPHLVDALPNGPRNHPTVRVFLAGGVPEVMLHLRREGLLDLDALTVSGDRLGRVLDWWEGSDRRRALRERLQVADGVDPDDVIMSPERARRLGLTSTVTFPRGNLAPEGSVIKSTAIDPTVVDADGVYRKTGPARVFTRERDAIAAIKSTGPGRVRPGDVLVLICRGPLGAGMEEIYQITAALKHLTWGKEVAVVTDARFSGVSTGACIGHVGPEALAGGPIGRVVEGDLVRIVVDRNRLEGSVDLVGHGEHVFGPEEGTRVLASRMPRPDLAPDASLPEDTRLWALLQQAGGGTWGGCVYDVDAIATALGRAPRPASQP